MARGNGRASRFDLPDWGSALLDAVYRSNEKERRRYAGEIMHWKRLGEAVPACFQTVSCR